jgi:hypothetical protein
MNFDRKIIKQIIIFICIIIFLIGSGILVYYQARIQDNYENNLIKDINEKKEKTYHQINNYDDLKKYII